MGERIVKKTQTFDKALKHIKDKKLKIKIFKQIKKVVENPSIGKPMKNVRKGTRELYIKPFRISYAYTENTITFLEFYHKDKQ
ncbi:type II toxin-antitoxin system RelE/ParE family toxin [Candidatus Woesearchaeota archaeon]|nr:type II toxin-antitoxin system RelE/ParE family toxin [Candidatus Woesearchaeota archaeon]